MITGNQNVEFERVIKVEYSKYDLNCSWKLKPRNPDNALDFEVTEAADKISLLHAGVALDKALSQYGLQKHNYGETQGELRVPGTQV